MPYRDLRAYLQRLEEAGEIVHIGKEVDPVLEISAIIRKVKEPAVFCHRVKGSDIPVVGNLFGNMKKIELILEVSREEIFPAYLERMKNPLPPRLVEEGEVQEVVWKGEEVDLGRLPIPVINGSDAGRYIDCGIVVAKDPEFGSNLSLHRLQVKGPQKLGIYPCAGQHLATYYQRAEEKGEPLEIAVVIGSDPVLCLASQVTGPIDMDEYAVAGGLRRQPVELVKCLTVDLEVPAAAEIVIEGRILPGHREKEGPFGEFPGYYGPPVQNPVVEVTAITCRRQPIFQMLYLGKPPTENVYLTSLTKAADLYRLVKECVSEVRGVYLTPGGCGRFHAVVSIKKRAEGEGKMALSAVLASRLAVKHAVVVDEDIDIYDPHDVEWAVATRSQFDRDSIVITGAPGMLDPLQGALGGPGLITKVGVDATRPLGYVFPEVCTVPDEIRRRVEENWGDYLKGS